MAFIYPIQDNLCGTVAFGTYTNIVRIFFFSTVPILSTGTSKQDERTCSNDVEDGTDQENILPLVDGILKFH